MRRNTLRTMRQSIWTIRGTSLTVVDHIVIASAAKQPGSRVTRPLGCFVASLAMTNQSSSTSRQNEHSGIVDQHFAIGLHRIGVRQLGGATLEKVPTGGAFERPQERLEAGGFHPLHDSGHAVEGIDVVGLPNLERGASRNQSRVETFDSLVEGSRFGDRQK